MYWRKDLTQDALSWWRQLQRGPKLSWKSPWQPQNVQLMRCRQLPRNRKKVSDQSLVCLIFSMCPMKITANKFLSNHQKNKKCAKCPCWEYHWLSLFQLNHKLIMILKFPGNNDISPVRTSSKRALQELSSKNVSSGTFLRTGKTKGNPKTQFL